MSNLYTCKFCGQARIGGYDYTDAAAGTEWATLECNCSEAKSYQAEQKRISDRKKNIETLKNSIESFDGYCAQRNAALSEDIKTALFNNALLVLSGVIESAIIKFERVTAKINQNSKGKVVLSFSYSDSAKTEV